MMKKVFFVLTFFISLFFTTPIAQASGASLYLSPNSGTFFTGNTFDISILLNTSGNNINAISVDLKFDPKKVQIINPSSGTSFISIWAAPPSYSNLDGIMSFRGGIPSPGINTSSGLALTITFRAIEPGETTIYFLDTSKVLLDDGKATEILNSMGSGKYTVSLLPPEGPIISSSTHPDQNKWYKNNNTSFSWNQEDGVTNFSYTLDNNSQGVPDNKPEGDKSFTSYSNIEDGIWYFHVRADKDGSWGGTSHYLVRIDNSSPASFKIEVNPSIKTSFKQPIISFFTTDSSSQIDRYTLKIINISIDNQDKEEIYFNEISTPYQLPSLKVGKYLVVVKAFDEAGNWKDESVEIEISPEKMLVTERGLWLWGSFLSWWPMLFSIFVILSLIFLLLIVMWKKEKKSRKRLNKDLKEKEKLIRRNIEKLRNNSLLN